MSKISFEIILNRCINLLLSGRSVSDCLKMYPKVRGLRQALQVAGIAAKLPKKKLEFDKNKVWQTIQSKMEMKKEESGNSADIPSQISPSPLNAFRLPFSKPIFSLITIIVIIGLVNATVAAAKNSLPGQTLYPVKRTVEKMELVLIINEEKKTEKKIEHVENRLYEAQQIVEQNTSEENEILAEKESKVVEKTITELIESTEEIAIESENNKELLEQVVLLADEQEEILAEIAPKVTGMTKEVVEEAIVAASESKVEAEENLAELEMRESENSEGDETATSTGEILEDGSEGEVEGVIDENETSTSTDDILEILGSPESSSTIEIIIPFSSNNTNTSSTPEIIDLR